MEGSTAGSHLVLGDDDSVEEEAGEEQEEEGAVLSSDDEEEEGAEEDSLPADKITINMHELSKRIGKGSTGAVFPCIISRRRSSFTSIGVGIGGGGGASAIEPEDGELCRDYTGADGGKGQSYPPPTAQYQRAQQWEHGEAFSSLHVVHFCLSLKISRC